MITLVYSKHRINFYINAIKKTLEKNKQVLFLVPEIKNINFLKSYIKKHFSKQTSFIFHSNLTEKKRYKIWEKVKSNKAKIILGTKIALFLPFKKLKLIILEEEESPNYNSFEKHPYYNGRDLAIKLSKLFNAKVILGTSCPLIESYYLASKNKYKIIRDNIQYSTSNIHIIDMRDEIKNGNSSIFSRFLQDSIKEIISSNKKAILFVNRRGMSTCILCMDCGYIIKCPYCEVPLVYHKNLPSIKDKSNNSYKLICHHCGYQQTPPSFCPKCKSYRIKYLGTGTQKIEYELKKISPNAKAIRLDTDIAKTRKKQKEIIEKFKNSNINFLICTQLVFSYLKQLPKLDLISIVNVSPILNLPDFKTGENTFRIITSFISHFSPSTFILQTYNPYNYVIKYALENNYDKFFLEEIKNRKELNYPPFSRLIKLTYQHKNAEKAEKEARILKEKLKQQLKFLLLNAKLQDMDFEILGPAPCFIPKIKNKWRWKIVIKIKCKKFLNGDIYLSERQVKIRNDLLKIIPNNWKIEIDPDTLL